MQYLLPEGPATDGCSAAARLRTHGFVQEFKVEIYELCQLFSTMETMEYI